tara:strand:- start:68 stop:1276 length:1209 start_codon:yes stop_codon:yes gene_type:complete
MKSSLSLYLLTLFLTTSISHADDYVWGEEFKEGDIISAETFNQIFSTLEKLNRKPRDSDLVGTWSCAAVSASTNDYLSTVGWTTNNLVYTLSGAQLTMTASASSTSLASPYSFSTSSPSPFIRKGGSANTASSGTYTLFNDMLIMRGIKSDNNDRLNTVYKVTIYSLTQFSLASMVSNHLTQSNITDHIMCESAIAVPAAPSGAAATNAQTLVNVTWTDNSADETGFKIYRRLSTETEATELATAVTASPYVDSTLTEGETAYYSVAAYNDNGESPKTNVVTATLDSILPTVVSTSPLDGAGTTGTTVSVTFNEPIIFTCLAGNGPSDCNGINDVLVTLVGDTPAGPYRMGSRGWTGTTINSSSAFVDGANSSYTVTVNSEFIYDLNGNKMAADYVFTFTDN